MFKFPEKIKRLTLLNHYTFDLGRSVLPFSLIEDSFTGSKYSSHNI